ncbi:MAG: TFIIH/NER complex subunit [Candelina mexicana]|nr:MAG: TFIIH/NER complex subunit [Candelina mexicana]
MSRLPQRNGVSKVLTTGEEDGEPHLPPLSLLSLSDRNPSTEFCPVCKSSRYLNPNMEFRVNPECYHKMCSSCVDRIFSQGPAPCPVAGCGRTLRKAKFRKQTFGDIQVEKEIDIRRRVAGIFNRRQDEFSSLLHYNNYLEKIEEITFNLLNNIDVAATEKDIATYQAQNAEGISQNASMQSAEIQSAAAHQKAQEEAARLRREAARMEEFTERREREEGKREVLEALATGEGNARRIAQEGQKVVLKRSGARRALAEQQQARIAQETFGGNTLNGAAGGGFFIEGLKPKVKAEPEKPYDPFGGLSDTRQYFTLQNNYKFQWLDKARQDPQMLAGGYNVKEYYTRALFDAFSGLGCFVQDEVGGRDMVASGTVATAAAAAASGD